MATNTATRALTLQLRHHPYRTLLVAAGFGYVLFTFKMLRIGARMGALPLVSRELAGVAEVALGSRAQT